MVPSLQPTHRGYEYQDLLTATRLVDLVLGTVSAAHVDVKEVDDDRFDDLTIITVAGRRERTQFKHTDNNDRPLSLDTFTTDKRGLRLDRLVAAAVADRDGPGRAAPDLAFRVVVRDTLPVDEALISVLVPADPDPGPFTAGMHTRRLRFDVDRLWPLEVAEAAAARGAGHSRFAFLRSGDRAVSRENLAWLCVRLIIEVEAPHSSGRMLEPGPAERVLLSRVRAEVGAESYPNVGRSAEDVADAFATFVRQARQGRTTPTADAMLQRAQLRMDFGAVSRAHPVDRSIEVARPTTVADVRAAAEQAASLAVPLLLTGPPGQGKSWTCDQLVHELTSMDWLVAEHYCYLNDTRDERDERVQAETVFGSLLGRLAEADPGLVEGQRPRYAADDTTLAEAVTRALEAQPERQVALIVDGLDHVSRVAPSRPGTDPSTSLASALAAVDIPVGSVLIVLSQPGEHLAPLKATGALTCEIPRLTSEELGALAANLGLVSSSETADPIVEEDQAESFLDLLEQRSRGNALYATYLCREVSTRPHAEADPEAVIRALPPFDGTLENYYTHLSVKLGPAAMVADVLGLLDFPVNRAELTEMRPDLAHWLDDALGTLSPVLAERATQGGMRIYHESFARFLRRRMDANPGAKEANLRFVIDWLQSQGFYRDERAFRFLLPTLAAAGREEEVLALVDVEFAATAVAHGHPASAVTANLAVATSCAGRRRDLPTMARCVELARAAQSFEYERLDAAVVDYIDVPIAVLGSKDVAARLVFDGRVAVPPRAGIQLCAAIDAAGEVAPWEAYLPAYLEWEKTDNTSYDEESDRAVTLAWVRGQLRLFATDRGFEQPWHENIAAFLDETGLPCEDTVPVAADVLGFDLTAELVDYLEQPEASALALVEAIGRSAGADTELFDQLLSVAAQGYVLGSVHRLLVLGVTVDDIVERSPGHASPSLAELTRVMVSDNAIHRQDSVNAWLDQCAIASRRNPAALSTAEAMLTGEGWYRCWLRFVLALTRAEAAESNCARLALDALGHLTEDLGRYTGSPRACDLYPIHRQIADTFRRAICLLDDDTWLEALAILLRTVEALGVSLRGYEGGPITLDTLLTLVIDATTTPARQPAAQELVDHVLGEGGGHRHYSTLAEHRLIAARFAVRCGDTSRAKRYWVEACRLNTAYGVRRDLTVYELLKPLTKLIAADPVRARIRLARIQSICEQVVLHTDGKDTYHAWPQWWSLLAEADPAALAELAVPALLERCGHVNDLYNDALTDLWRSWHHLAEPVVAGALRLALLPALDDADPAMAERLADIADGTGTDLPGQLLTLLLARVDERPISYTYSNSSEMVAADTAKVEAINAAAARANAPQVFLISTAGEQPQEQPIDTSQNAAPADARQTVVDDFPNGPVGLARAIRAWRRRTYGSTSVDQTPHDLADIISRRLVEVAQAGDEQHAEAAMHSLAGTLNPFDQSGLLASIGADLERHGQTRLAAVAFTLLWTRTRGKQDWMNNFGSFAELESLRHATRLDLDTAWTTVASEVARVVTGSSGGSIGVSQALIHSSMAGGLTLAEASLDTAFAVWDAAQEVIAFRTPKMSDNDELSKPYLAPPPSVTERLTADIDAIFSKAVIGVMAHPGQENRRRALLAFQILLRHRTEAAVSALADTLGALKEPALLSWLLKVAMDIHTARTAVAERCQNALRKHASGPHLTVRAFAAHLLGDSSLLPPATPPDDALLATGTLLVPKNCDQPRDNTAMHFTGMLAGYRLGEAEHFLPRLTRAVVARVEDTVSDEDHMKMIDEERQKLADVRHKRWADAFTGHEALVEDALQRAAAGGRLALVAAGEPPSQPATWEYELALLLVNDPSLPLAIEQTRQPRPNIVPPPATGDPIWQQAFKASDKHADSVLAVQPPFTPAESCDIVPAGQFRGWRVLASTEQHVSPDSKDHLCQSNRDRAVMFRHHDTVDLPDSPFVVDAATNWCLPVTEPPALESTPQLIGINHDSHLMADLPFGLGLHRPLLVPSGQLMLALGLRVSEEPFALHTGAGPALAMITWRSHYEVGAYHLPWPRLQGCALVASPDAFDRLLVWGRDHLVVRELIHGGLRLAEAQE